MFRSLGCIILIAVVLPARGGPGFHTGESIEIGGIQQWITINGYHSTDPVLLFLHGGPGNSAMGYSDRFTGELQKHFIVVQWDQRESGKTAQLNGSPVPLSVALMEGDAVEMIRYLLTRFSQNKIYLMGHSWGGFLGLVVAAHHPELLHGYLAISPMIYQVESERLSLLWLKEKEVHNPEASAELSTVVVPFQNAGQLYVHRKWLAIEMGTKFASRAYVEGWAQKWLPVFNEASQINFFEIAPEIKCPVYFFIGGKDHQTHYKLAEEYYRALKADKKQLFWFADSGHNLILTEPKRFQDIVIREIIGKKDKTAPVKAPL
jgi:pimeloyl-ACP methyl ester carboxylesterase